MKAFVVMPFGGTDSSLVKEYNRVYRYLIKDSVLQYDSEAEVQRQDYSLEGGQIIRNVISNIANADIVIVDLSGGNWNVAYELGLRHVMSKFGTILICNDKTERPYDVQHLNIITYSAEGWLDNVEELTDQIAKAIKKAMARERSDSPVFDVFSALPSNLTEMLSNTNDDEQRRLMLMSKELNEAKQEVDRLRRRIEEAGLDSTDNPSTKNIRSMFGQAVKTRELYSDAAVAKLRELADAKDYEGFSDFLSKVLEHGYLDEIDCQNVYRLCRRMGIPDITRIYLETVVEFYPENEELKALLANAYSQDYHNREKALSLVNESVGIRRRDGKVELIPKVRSIRLLGSMFDVYLHLNKYEDLISIGELLLLSSETNSKQQPVIYRNLCIASIKLEQFDKAEAYLKKLLEIVPDNASSFYCSYKYYDAIEDHVEAYKSIERCIQLAPEDEDYYFMLAGEICDERLARKPDTGTIKEIDYADRERYAAPFVWKAVLNDISNNYQRAINFFKRNKFVSCEENLLKLVKGELTLSDLLSLYDFSMVEYCYQMK